MSTIKFRLAAKTDVGLVRTNNEDNFQVASDLSAGQMHWLNNEICSLGENGALLVVADGMGGMNAGEVASELAINTVREYFAPENLTPEIMKNRFSIEKYMNDVIVAADARIKQEAKMHPETRGMGTTIVIGWLLDGKLYVSWCGDSRAYVYNPDAGLHQITIDHSYVQSLVDKGAISREDAFDFPDSNIITRSLSDGSAKAKPESLLKPYTLCDNDIILLCTDGLCGMIRDNEMEAVIRNSEHNMDALVDDLIHAACEAEGSDNITICVCQILQGGAVCNPATFEETEKRLNGRANNFIRTVIDGGDDDSDSRKRRWFYIMAAVCAVLLLAGVCIWCLIWHHPKSDNHAEDVKADTVKVNVQTDKDPSVENTETGKDSKDKPATDQTKEKGQGSATTRIRQTTKPAKEAEEPARRDESQVSEDVDEITLIGHLDDTSDKKDKQDENIEETDVSEPETEDKLLPVKNTEEYKVLKGDTYSQLARKFGTTVEALQALNGGKDLKAGDTIIVPANK